MGNSGAFSTLTLGMSNAQDLETKDEIHGRRPPTVPLQLNTAHSPSKISSVYDKRGSGGIILVAIFSCAVFTFFAVLEAVEPIGRRARKKTSFKKSESKLVQGMRRGSWEMVRAISSCLLKAIDNGPPGCGPERGDVLLQLQDRRVPLGCASSV